MKAVHDKKAFMEKTNSFLNSDFQFDFDGGIGFHCDNDFESFQFDCPDIDLSIDRDLFII
jgi:hypothetical protein